jgi:hypothetical protein
MSIQVTPPQITMMKMLRHFANLSTRPNVPFWSSLAGLASHTEHVSKGELKT